MPGFGISDDPSWLSVSSQSVTVASTTSPGGGPCPFRAHSQIARARQPAEASSVNLHGVPTLSSVATNLS
jgi:hypothetical protein